MVSLNLLLVATVWTYWNHEPADHLRRMSSIRAVPGGPS